MEQTQFKKNEGLAKKVMDILLNDYVRREEFGTGYPEEEYLEVLEWSLKDYQCCGFKMDGYRAYIEILKRQHKQKLNRLRDMN